MISITFETHSISADNEAHLASGHYDVELSALGAQLAEELGKRHENEQIDAVLCSDLQRAYRTAEIAFGTRGIPIIKDARLRECDYGDLARRPHDEIEKEKPRRIFTPFPNGESYEQAAQKMKSFLNDLLQGYDGKKVIIVGHMSTYYSLEHLVKGVPLIEAITAHWSWQPGWAYRL